MKNGLLHFKISNIITVLILNASEIERGKCEKRNGVYQVILFFDSLKAAGKKDKDLIEYLGMVRGTATAWNVSHYLIEKYTGIADYRL